MDSGPDVHEQVEAEEVMVGGAMGAGVMVVCHT